MFLYTLHDTGKFARRLIEIKPFVDFSNGNDSDLDYGCLVFGGLCCLYENDLYTNLFDQLSFYHMAFHIYTRYHI